MINKLKEVLKKEFLYYFITLIVLVFIMHSDLLSDPSSRLALMKEKENYTHPFLYTFVVYFVMLMLRVVINFIAKIFEKNK